ncbi:MAG: GNAT family N-acetyltransferase [Oscillospiraceae bacterium]|nr:GNAT family N-acetyltransferase [Oscillospiraceae bacterium]
MSDNKLKIIENTPIIYTDRLILRPFSESDIYDLFLILKDKEVNAFLPWFPLETLEQAHTHLHQNYLKYYNQPSAYRYAVCLKSDNCAIGYINIAGDTDNHDFGYGLMKNFWHKGIVTEAGMAVVERLKNAGYDYITATHDVKNSRSGEVMKKLGMKYCYSYIEQWQPKDISVTFRMYQLNFNETDEKVFMKYWYKYPEHFIEYDI